MRQNINISSDTRKQLEELSKYHKLKMSGVLSYLINKEHRAIEKESGNFGVMGNHGVSDIEGGE